MSTTFLTKQALLDTIFADGEDSTKRVETVARHVIGNVAWTVTKVASKVEEDTELRYVSQYQCFKNEDGEWSYKATPEMEGIPSLDCPLGFLDLVSPDKEMTLRSAVWRDEVREYQQVLAEQASAENALLAELDGIYPSDSLEFEGYAL